VLNVMYLTSTNLSSSKVFKRWFVHKASLSDSLFHGESPFCRLHVRKHAGAYCKTKISAIYPFGKRKCFNVFSGILVPTYIVPTNSLWLIHLV
jgi:hypothetical protein